MDLTSVAKLLDDVLNENSVTRENAQKILEQAKQSHPNELVLALVALAATDALESRRQQAVLYLSRLLTKVVAEDIDTGIVSDGQMDPCWGALTETTQTTLKREILTAGFKDSARSVQNVLVDFVTKMSVCLHNSTWSDIPQLMLNAVAQGDASNSQRCFALQVLARLSPKIGEFVLSHLTQVGGLLRALFQVNDDKLRLCTIEFILNMVLSGAGTRDLLKALREFCPVIINFIDKLASDICGEAASSSSSAGNGAAGPSSDLDSEEILEDLVTMLSDAVLTGGMDYFKPSLKQLVERCCYWARVKKLSSEIRRSLVEFVCGMVQQSPRALQKMNGFAESLVDILMEFMLEMDNEADAEDDEHDVEWFTEDSMNHVTGADEDDEENDLELSNYSCGERNLDIVAEAMGGKYMMPIIFRKVSEYLQHDDWKHKVVAIMSVFQTIEFLPEDRVESQLKDVVGLLLKEAQNVQGPRAYRVRYAALRALGQVALDHQPFMQQSFHTEVLPVLISSFDDPIAKIQSQALSSFVNFSEALDIDDLLPLAHVVMEKIMIRLASDFSLPSDSQFPQHVVEELHQNIREQCITASAVVSGVLGEHFIPWYPRLVPLMKTYVDRYSTMKLQHQQQKLLQSQQNVSAVSKNEEQKVLYRHSRMAGRALECLSLIAFSIGVKEMESEAVQLVQVLVRLYQSDTSTATDPLKDYSFESLCRMIPLMQDKFSPFLPEIMPYLLQQIQEMSKPYLPAGAASNGASGTVNAGIATTGGGRTYDTLNLKNDLKVLSLLIKAVKQAFMPWVEQCMSLLPVLVSEELDSAIRFEALTCISAIMHEMSQAATPANDSSASRRLLSEWLLTIVKIVLDNLDCSELLFLNENQLVVEGLARCIESAGPNVLTKDNVDEISGTTFQLLQKLQETRGELEQRRHELQQLDDDDEEAELMDDMNSNKLLKECLIRVLEGLMLNHADLFMECRNGAAMCVQFVEKFARQRDASDSVPMEDDQAIAMQICCELVEKLKERGVAMITPFLPDIFRLASRSSKAAHPDISQPALYAIDLCMRFENVNSEVVQQAAKLFESAVTASDAFDEANAAATENAVAGLFDIVNHHASKLLNGSSPELAHKYADIVINALPFKADVEEGCRVLRELLNVISNDTASIYWGVNQSRAGRLLGVFAKVYKEDSSEDDVDDKIRALINKIGLHNVPALLGQSCKMGAVESRGFKRIERDLMSPAAAAKTSSY